MKTTKKAVKGIYYIISCVTNDCRTVGKRIFLSFRFTELCRLQND